jgi:hypothetical protein
MISANGATHPQPIWRQIGSSTSEDWRGFVYAAGYAADERSAPLHVVRDLEAVLARVSARDAELGRELREVVLEAKTAIYDTALVLGVALARTWPDRLEDLDAWSDRALALADLAPRAPASSARDRSVAPASAASAFEGETIADVVERSGSIADKPYDWLELAIQALWEESPHRHAFEQVDEQSVDLVEHGAPVAVDVFGALDDARADQVCAALDYAGRLGYALGRYEHLPEPERIARARALANLSAIRRSRSLLTIDEWRAVRRRRRTEEDTSAAT